MGSSSARTCLIWCITIPLLVLVILLFLGTIIIAALGIDRAAESNICRESNRTQNCLPQEDLEPPVVNGVRSQEHRVVEGANINEYIYYMAGATACGILLAFVATFGLTCLEYAIYRIRKDPSDDTDGHHEAMEMTQMGGATEAGKPLHMSASSPTPPPQHPINEVKSDVFHAIVVKSDVKLRKLVDKNGVAALFMLFLSLVFFILAIMSMLWAVAVGYNFTRGGVREVYPFVVVELLSCVLFPMFLFVSVVFMAVVLHYVTRGALDGRQILPRLLPNVKFETGEKSDFWIIANSFYFTLKRRPSNKDDDEETRKKLIGCSVCYSCFPNFATWIISALAGLCFILAVSFFVDRTIDTQMTVTACNDTGIDHDFSCFNASTLVYVDCVTDTATELLHCFKFYEFGVDVDIVTSLAAAFAFYLVAVNSITTIFVVLQILLHLKNSKLWGALFVTGGFLGLMGMIAVVIIWATGYIEASLPELPRLNIVNLAQLIMVCLFVVLVGILIITSTWVEKVPNKEKKPGDKTSASAATAAAAPHSPKV